MFCMCFIFYNLVLCCIILLWCLIQHFMLQYSINHRLIDWLTLSQRATRLILITILLYSSFLRIVISNYLLWFISVFSCVLFIKRICYVLYQYLASSSSARTQAPIGAWGVMTPPLPPLFEAKGDGGHNLGIIHISHIALITPLH